MRTIAPDIEYFSTFAVDGYMLVPISPVTFAETEDAASYYEAERDAAGTIYEFRKIGVVRNKGADTPHTLAESRTPGSTVYFETQSDLVGSATALDYPSTEGLDNYYSGTVESDGRHVNLQRHARHVVFSESTVKNVPGRVLPTRNNDLAKVV